MDLAMPCLSRLLCRPRRDRRRSTFPPGPFLYSPIGAVFCSEFCHRKQFKFYQAPYFHRFRIRGISAQLAVPAILSNPNRSRVGTLARGIGPDLHAGATCGSLCYLNHSRARISGWGTPSIELRSKGDAGSLARLIISIGRPLSPAQRLAERPVLRFAASRL